MYQYFTLTLLSVVASATEQYYAHQSYQPSYPADRYEYTMHPKYQRSKPKAQAINEDAYKYLNPHWKKKAKEEKMKIINAPLPPLEPEPKPEPIYLYS